MSSLTLYDHGRLIWQEVKTIHKNTSVSKLKRQYSMEEVEDEEDYEVAGEENFGSSFEKTVETEEDKAGVIYDPLGQSHIVPVIANMIICLFSLILKCLDGRMDGHALKYWSLCWSWLRVQAKWINNAWELEKKKMKSKKKHDEVGQLQRRSLTLELHEEEKLDDVRHGGSTLKMTSVNDNKQQTSLKGHSANGTRKTERSISRRFTPTVLRGESDERYFSSQSAISGMGFGVGGSLSSSISSTSQAVA